MASRTVVAALSVDSDVAIALSNLAAQAANTVLLNATAGSAVPTAFSLPANHVLMRRAGNIIAGVDTDLNALTGFSPAIQAEAGVVFTGSYTPGSILVVNVSGGLEWLAPGSHGQVLTMNAGGDGVEWV